LNTHGIKLEAAERTNECAGRYAAACRAIGLELGLPVVDLWSSFQEVTGWQKILLCDGLHLTQQGNALVGMLVTETITTAFPSLNPESMRFDFPEWSVLGDAEDCEVAIAAHVAVAGGKEKN